MEEQQTQANQTKAGDQFSKPLPQNLPNSKIILVLGILSIVFCWWHLISIIGIVLGILALILAHRETALYQANPGQYSITSFNNVKTGRVCAIIGLTISIVVFVFVMMLIVGILATLPFWGMI